MIGEFPDAKDQADIYKKNERSKDELNKHEFGKKAFEFFLVIADLGRFNDTVDRDADGGKRDKVLSKAFGKTDQADAIRLKYFESVGIDDQGKNNLANG